MSGSQLPGLACPPPWISRMGSPDPLDPSVETACPADGPHGRARRDRIGRRAPRLDARSRRCPRLFRPSHPPGQNAFLDLTGCKPEADLTGCQAPRPRRCWRTSRRRGGRSKSGYFGVGLRDIAGRGALKPGRSICTSIEGEPGLRAGPPRSREPASRPSSVIVPAHRRRSRRWTDSSRRPRDLRPKVPRIALSWTARGSPTPMPWRAWRDRMSRLWGMRWVIEWIDRDGLSHRGGQNRGRGGMVVGAQLPAGPGVADPRCAAGPRRGNRARVSPVSPRGPWRRFRSEPSSSANAKRPAVQRAPRRRRS